jgi:hypothetical protein
MKHIDQNPLKLGMHKFTGSIIKLVGPLVLLHNGDYHTTVSIIIIIILISLALAIGFFFNYRTIEGADTLAQSYGNTAMEETKNMGFSSGYAGSGRNVSSAGVDFTQYSKAPTESQFNELSKYKVGSITDLDVQYHDTPEEIAVKTGNDSILGKAVVKDKDGNVIALPPVIAQQQVTYYQPGTFVHGSSSYVPKYEDSVYLSRTSGGAFLDSKNSAPINAASYIQGGICSYYKDNPDGLEQACNRVDSNTCASTSCCVLLGGSKCVSGDETGAKMKANYSDIYIKNRDYYYYQGKCYGNCP